ncbi:MAG: monofunctional biosynthetic peptidoglycan transglycosylase [Burkholderiales bacterium]|nr:monofunctional biosynthetic peptidoglycan transglycosylase [Burkholderiales bacterium]
MKVLRLFGRILLVLILLFLAYQLWVLGHVLWWRDHNPSDTAFMDEQRDVLQTKDPKAELKHEWVPYERISPNLKRALIAGEDAKFLDHEGFDWEGIQAAWEKNKKKGRITAGGSTISQQLAKNLFLSGRRSYIRKFEEATITVMLEHILDKRRILEIYLNVIEWGNGVFGAEAGARHYYGTSAASLNEAQAARMAAMVPNPRFYDTHRNSKSLQRRTAIILRRMDYADIPD